MRRNGDQRGLPITVLCGGLAVAALSIAGCSSLNRAIGAAKITPDEFRVVAKAPLVVPPDYALRPPSPGEPRPQELEPETAAQVALIGQREAASRSQGENLLTSRAGVEHADPLIRYTVDDEFGDVAHKDKTFADRVMFWRKAPAVQPGAVDVAATQTPAPIDPAAEAARVKSLTGDKPVLIQRAKDAKVKLPGL